MKTRVNVVTTLAFVLVLVGCGGQASTGSSGTGSAGPIVIGLQAPFTGDYGIYGQAYLRGINVWMKQNGDTINGSKVTVKQVDDNCDVATGVAAFRKVSSTLTALMGPACSSVVKAVAPLIETAKVPALFLGQSASLTLGYKGGWLFRLTQPDTANQSEFANYVLSKWQTAGYKKLAILHDTSVLDNNAPQQWTALASPKGFQIVDSESFDLGATDFTSQVLKVKQASPDAVIIQTYGPEEARVFATMGQMGVSYPSATGTDTAYPSTIKAAGAALNGGYFYSDYISGSGNAALAGFETTFAQLYPMIQPQDIDYEAWLGMSALGAALKQSGASAGGAALRDALHSAKFNVGDIEVSFAPNGDQSTVLTFIGQVQNGSTKVVDVLKKARNQFSDYTS